MEQPLPQQPTESSETKPEEETPNKPGIQGMITVVKKLSKKSPKAMLIIVLVGFTLTAMIFLSIVSLFRRTKPSRGPISLVPTPAENRLTPSPKPSPGKEEVDQLLDDINAFDPTKKDLDLPSVDLLIGL